jgi:hypothetical protein
VLRVHYVLKIVLLQEMKQMKNSLWICANFRVQVSKDSSCMSACFISETNADILTTSDTGGSTPGFLNNKISAWFEIVTAVAMKSSIFSDIMTISPVKVNWCFGEHIFSIFRVETKQEISMKQAGNFRSWRWRRLSSGYMAVYVRKQNYAL